MMRRRLMNVKITFGWCFCLSLACGLVAADLTERRVRCCCWSSTVFISSSSASFASSRYRQNSSQSGSSSTNTHRYTTASVCLCFAPHDRTALVSWARISHSWIRRFTPNRYVKQKHPMSTAKNWPIISYWKRQNENKKCGVSWQNNRHEDENMCIFNSTIKCYRMLQFRTFLCFYCHPSGVAN